MQEPHTIAGAGPDPQGETAPQRLHPSVRIVWWIEAALIALPVAVVAAMAAVAVSRIDDMGPLWLAPALVAPTALLLAALVPVIRYRTWAYALREEDLWIRSGVLWRKVTVIPYIRLQFVDTRQGPIERFFDLAQLVVHTAAVGTSGHVPGLETRAATALRERLSQLEGDTGGL